jgi:hypothetical protein
MFFIYILYIHKMSDTQYDWKIIALKVLIALVIIGIVIGIAVIVLYLMYYRYSLLSGSEKLPYTLTVSTHSSSYTDDLGTTIACIWPVGSIEYRPNDAKIEQMAPATFNPQYLPAITDGQWPTTFTYSMLYSNSFGPYSIANSIMVTQTSAAGKMVNLSYPIGTKVTAKLNKELKLICVFEDKGNLINVPVSDNKPAVPVGGSSSDTWWASRQGLLDDLDEGQDVPAGGTTKSAFMFRRGSSYV